MSKASIKLTKYTAEYNYDPDQRKGWALLVRATDAVNMDREIFVYHRMSQKDAYTGDLFEAIASVNQYYEIPKNAPKLVDGGGLIPYYRRNQMEVFARTLHELNEIWEYVKVDVGRLVTDINSIGILDSVAQSQVSSDGVVADFYEYPEITTMMMHWQPAGNWDGSSIVNPNSSKAGWLPISEFENEIADAVDSVPDQAVWFYNINAHEEFKRFYNKVKAPYETNFLELNGQELLYGSGGSYALTKDTVFWLENKNYDVEEIQKNPWANDYIDGLPVSYEPLIRLIMPL